MFVIEIEDAGDVSIGVFNIDAKGAMGMSLLGLSLMLKLLWGCLRRGVCH